MRDYKFRGWDGQRWHYAVLQGDGFHYLDVGRLGSPLIKKWVESTGLKDKNGKEIYEGDIVKVRDWIGSIVWHESGWFLDNQKWFEGLMGIVNFNQDVEVIGNIYENPNLLTP